MSTAPVIWQSSMPVTIPKAQIYYHGKSEANKAWDCYYKTDKDSVIKKVPPSLIHEHRIKIKI